MGIQKIGGYGSLINALLMVLFLLVAFQPNDFYDPARGFETISAGYHIFYILYFGLVLSGICYIPMVLALRERMKNSMPNIMGTAIIGVSIACTLWFAAALVGCLGMPLIVSAKDASAYTAVGTVILSVASGGDCTVGFILLLVGCAALKIKTFSRILCYVFILKGLVMILSISIEPLVIVGIILGLLFYPWLGIVLLKSEA
jgi:hypothetical protein